MGSQFHALAAVSANKRCPKIEVAQELRTVEVCLDLDADIVAALQAQYGDDWEEVAADILRQAKV